MAVPRGSISDALDKYLEASKSKTVLVGPLEKYLLLNPPGTERSSKVLHPSEVVADDWCPRYNQMLIEGLVEPKAESLRLRTQSIFAEGHAIHSKWQDWLGRMGVLYGVWRCTACGAKCWHLGRPSDLCDHSECVVYDEVPLRHGLWGGHADGIVESPDLTASALLEIKSVGSGTIRWGAPHLMASGADLTTAFGKINQPFKKHIQQIQIYMELAARMCADGDPEMRAVESCVVLYECKADQAVKEFVVRRDPSYVLELLEYADEMESLVGTGELIECPWRECKYEHN